MSVFELFSMQKSFRNGSKTRFRTLGAPQGPKIFACGAQNGLKNIIFLAPGRAEKIHIRKPPPIRGRSSKGGAFLSVIVLITTIFIKKSPRY